MIVEVIMYIEYTLVESQEGLTIWDNTETNIVVVSV